MAASPSPLSPEFALLAACALLDDERLAQVAGPLARRDRFDWQRFVELGAFHGVGALAQARLDRAVPGAIPADQAARLHGLQVQGAALNAAHARCTVRVVEMLEKEGIPALVLKGAALAAQLYAPQRELRVSSDIDILVAPDRLRAADAALRRGGLARSWPETIPPEKAWPMFFRLANVFDYRGAVLDEVVELHGRATLNPHALPVSFAELEAASVAVETGHGTVRTLGGPLQVQYLCQHSLLQLPHRLKWFGDIARALRLAGESDCAAFVASYPKPLPLRPALFTGRLLRQSDLAIEQTAARGPARPSRDFVRIVRVMERGEDFPTARTFARLPHELRHLLFVLRLTPGWRGKAYEFLRALSDPRDAVSLRLGPRFAVVYALAGPILALRRFIRRSGAGTAPVA